MIALVWNVLTKLSLNTYQFIIQLTINKLKDTLTALSQRKRIGDSFMTKVWHQAVKEILAYNWQGAHSCSHSTEMKKVFGII